MASPITVAEFATLHGHPVGTVKAWLSRGQLMPVARTARGRRLLDPAARPRLAGPSLVRMHAHHGLLCVAAGPGKLRRVSLRERAQDAAGVPCACPQCDPDRPEPAPAELAETVRRHLVPKDQQVLAQLQAERAQARAERERKAAAEQAELEELEAERPITFRRAPGMRSRAGSDWSSWDDD